MATTLVCVVLIAAQTAGLASLMINSKPKADKYLSAKDRFTVSAQDNTILFLLDGVSNSLFEEILDNNSDIAKGLKDFSYYNNANCVGRVTFPGLQNWMTGIMYDGTISVGQYFKNCWESEKAADFYAKLHEKNYVVNLYVPEYTVTDNIQYLENIADNITQRNDPKIDMQKFMSLFKLSAFRNFPLLMKATMWVSTDDIQGIVSRGKTNWIKSDYRFITDFRESGLTVDSEKNYYIVQYMDGAHVPYRSDENGHYAEKGTDELRQTTGYFRIVLEYIEQLKELGIYDRATIIISADHGAEDRLQFAYLIKKPGDSHEEMQVTNAPISPQLEHFGTVMSILGEEGFGTSVFDYHENQVVERVCTYTVKRDDYPAVKKYGTDAEGNYNVIYVVKYQGDRYTLENEYREPDEILPMKDSFW